MVVVVHFGAVTLVDHNVEGRVADAVTVDVVVGLEILTPWLVTGVGCVVIWPATVPKPVMHRRREVALSALPVEVRSDPGNQAQKEVEESMFGSVG